MIEYLEKLVEEKQYEKALAYAEQLLLNPDNTSWDLMVVYSVLAQVRCELGEFYGAQVAGQLATRMARDLEAWDYYGHATAWLGLSYDRLRQLENALSSYYDYLAYVAYYKDASKYHISILFNIGLAHAKLGRPDEALRALHNAAGVAQASKDERKAHGIRHALIDAHLRYGQLEEIPSLLALCGYYLRHNPTVADYTQSLLWHLVLRVRYALATKRPRRALRVASRGVRLAKGFPEIAYQFHLLLARVHEQLGDPRAAIGEGVRARAAAIEARRYDFEFEVTDYIYSLLSFHPDLMQRLGDESGDAWAPRIID